MLSLAGTDYNADELADGKWTLDCTFRLGTYYVIEVSSAIRNRYVGPSAL
jgi:hypothetical protein